MISSARRRCYVIVGAGLVGGMLAAQFTQVGIRAVLVARGAQLAAIRSHGLRMLRPSGAEVVRLEVVGSPAEVQLAPCDVLVLATKAQQAEAALQEWALQPVHGVVNGTAASSLPVLMLQNGLDSERAALRRFATVYSASIWAEQRLPESRRNLRGRVTEGRSLLDGSIPVGHGYRPRSHR